MFKRGVSLIIIMILSGFLAFNIGTQVQAAEGLVLVNDISWYWFSETYINSVTCGDVDGDGANEIVTGGYYDDFSREVAQLCIWDGASLALEGVRTWYWTGDTGIESVAIGDVDADPALEIVTGGWYYDGTRYQAQLCVWDGASLALEGVRTWYWTGETSILSLDIGDVDADPALEIVTGGYYDDGTRYRAQLCVWDGATLALENVRIWYWTDDTTIWAVDIGDTNGGGDIEIVTGGYYRDGAGRKRAQLCVWDGASLALEGVRTWYWTGDTEIQSVAVDDFDISAGMEIVTGGWYDSGAYLNAQVCVWQGTSLTLDYPAQHWITGGNTQVYAVALGDWDGDFLREVITGGSHWDDSYGYCAEIWIGAFFESEGFKGWGGEAQESWIDSSYIRSVATSGASIITGGAHYDGTRYVAHLGVWTKNS
jgi:hypothetical protein